MVIEPSQAALLLLLHLHSLAGLDVTRFSGVQLTRALSLRVESGAASAFGLFYRKSYD